LPEEALTVMQWYVVQAYTGYEKQVQQSLHERIKLNAMQDKFGDILVPTEEVIELRGGQKRKSNRKFFPGYVLVQMEMDNATWHLVREAPKVLGFIGDTGGQPTPLSDSEAEEIQQRMQEGQDSPKPKVLYQVGEVVRVTDGVFKDFSGVVEAIDYEKNRLKVSVLIFSRSTPVELDFDQVCKE